MKILTVIPARGGSKGIPKKNIKPLNGKSLIYYSIEVARALFPDEDICVSTESDEIIETVEKINLDVPFKRPVELATDTASSNDVLLHAVDFYENHEHFYDALLLLQPTSPLRTVEHVREAIALYRNDIDMVVSVKESNAPYGLCKENRFGFLEFTFSQNCTRRQDMPVYYEYNGAIYVINIQALKSKGIEHFSKIIKYIMPAMFSVDIDTQDDWDYTEYLLQSKINNQQ